MTQAAEPTKTPPFQNECPQAYTNPKCPYITPINQNINAMKNVEKTLIALMGTDGTGLNNGVIHRILSKLEHLENCQQTQKIIEHTEQKTKLSGKDKAAVYGTFCTMIGIVVTELTKLLM